MAAVARPRPPRRLAAAVAVALIAGCAARGETTPGRRLKVAAHPFALAEVARRVGLDRVAVSDQGDAVLDAGGDPDPWLDPVAMQQVTQSAADALSRADPAGRAAYQAAARAYRAQLGALDIDYRSSLADCALHDIVTADHALARTGARYNFTDHGATDAGVADVARIKGVKVVFTEPDVPAAPIHILAQTTHMRVDQIDTLTMRTPEETARGATYLSLMADNLAKLRTALQCTGGGAT